MSSFPAGIAALPTVVKIVRSWANNFIGAFDGTNPSKVLISHNDQDGTVWQCASSLAETAANRAWSVYAKGATVGVTAAKASCSYGGSLVSDDLTVNTNGVTVTAGGVAVTAGGVTVTAGNILPPTGSTGMTTGFTYVPSAAGAPTGTPTTTNRVPLYYDTTNNRLYVYAGSWLLIGGAQPAARAFNSGNLSINSATYTKLTFDSERFDNDGIHSTASNTGRLTCATAGKYLIVFNGLWASNATGQRQAAIYLNNTTEIGDVYNINLAANNLAFTVTTIYDLAVNDYVEARVYQDSGGPLNILNAANVSPEFSMVRIGI